MLFGLDLGVLSHRMDDVEMVFCFNQDNPQFLCVRASRSTKRTVPVSSRRMSDLQTLQI